MRRKQVLTAILTAFLCISSTIWAACPSADLSGDCKVNFDDFAILASEWLTTYDAIDLTDMSSQWLDVWPACPSADLSGDCKVNLDDYAILASGWLTTYDADDLADMTFQWLDNWSFITTWDTSLGDGTTVALALAGTVDAKIDWGDGTVEFVTYSGPTHNYGDDGIYTVSVTGSVTAYNSFSYGGVASNRAKLISVDSWGQLGFTSMYRAYYNCTNLGSVPPTSDGIEAVADMGWMFYDASAFNSDIGGWDTSGVADMSLMFVRASAFNSDIGGWDTSSVTDMDYMFYDADSFNRDLSGWCVTLIPSEPTDFDTGASSWILPNSRPDWGAACPP